MKSFSTNQLELQKLLHHISSFASSDLGKDAILNLEPISNLEALSTTLNHVSEMKRALESDPSFPIDGIKNVREALRRSQIEFATLDPIDLLHLASSLKASSSIRTYFEKRHEIYHDLAEVARHLYIDKILEFNITKAIDENGIVRDDASRELRMIREDIASMYVQLRKQLEKILRSIAEQGIAQEEIITTRDGRLVIPIKTEQKGKVPGFIHSTSASGATVFIEPTETLQLNNELLELIFREKREIEKILRELTEQVKSCFEPIQKTIDVLEYIDSLFAKAKYSIRINGNKPLLKNAGALKLIQAKHPLLLLRLNLASVVPLTLEIGDSYQTLIISGPNAGGKSVALKTVGILVLMNQCGIHIPASPDSEMRIFDSVFLDIGDDQSIENDLSTFSSHLLRMKNLLELVDDNSLVLIDEIGTGTDPAEGGAIAASILKHLTAIGALTIASTHQVYLKAFAHDNEGMENGSMEFDQASLAPTYRFKAGAPGSSYAFEIAQRLGLSENILEIARQLAGEQGSRLERLLNSLENRSQVLENQLTEVDKEKETYRSLVAIYEMKISEQRRELTTIRSKALNEAHDILDRTNATIEQTVKEIRESQGEKATIRSARTRLTNLESELQVLQSDIQRLENAEKEESGYIPKSGDRVKLRKGSDIGEVLAVEENGDFVKIAFGSIKLKVKRSEIIEVAEKSAAISTTIIEKTVERKLDIRGLYGNDAVDRLDKFIDDAMLSDLHQVEIIHGKGTGALRRRVTEFLKSDKRIKSFRLGEWNEGGMGVTIIELI